MAKKKKKKTSSRSKARAPIFPVLSDEIFTDREDLLSLLKEKALEAKSGALISTVLIGQRRVGKTEVLRRLYNALFWEQDEVVPVYISFEEVRRTTEEFAAAYLRNFLAQYVGFKLKDAKVAKDTGKGVVAAKGLIKKKGNDPLAELLERYEFALKAQYIDEQLVLAIRSPRLVAGANHEPIFVMLDEFQHVIEIKDKDGSDANAIGKYQATVEPGYCPHLVTGSAVTLLTKDIIGRGSLYGRFRAEYIRGLEGYYVMELAEKLGKHHCVKINPEMAGELTRRTGGNPFYITCIFGGAKQIRKDLDNIDNVNDVISYELTQGAIWSELYRQLNYYFSSISEKGITKNIFYFASRYQDEKIDPKRIAENMSHWGVKEEDVREVLLALSRADLIEEQVAGTEFYNVKDPILREFADAWARVDVEGETWEATGRELLQRYRKMLGRFSDFKGYTAELMVKFMMTKFDGREVAPKEYFGAARSKSLERPDFRWVDSRRVKTPTSPEYQIDIIGAGAQDLWLVEVKYTEKPIGIGDVKKFERACKVAVKVITGDVITRWYISAAGFTKQAVSHLRKEGFLYSDKDQVNALLELFGLRELPVM